MSVEKPTGTILKKPMAWPKDNTLALKSFYGDPTGRGEASGSASQLWMARNLVRVPVPWHMVLAWDKHVSCGAIQFHEKAAPALARVLAALWEAANHDQARINEAGLNLFGGSFNYRVKRGLSSLSVHAFGAAVDFDPGRNGLGDKTPYMPEWVRHEFEREGAVWGGKFSRPDGMHFQFATI